MKVKEMTKVSSVFIITSSVIPEHLTSLNNWLEKEGVLGPVPLQKISSETSAGTKYPQRTLYWGGFNFLREDAFVDVFKSLEWEGAVLILGSEDADNGYRIVVGDSQGYESRIKLEIPSIDTDHFSLVEINEYRNLKKESEEYFQNLEL